MVLIIFGKFIIWFALMKLFRYSVWTSIAVAAGLTQIGEPAARFSLWRGTAGDVAAERLPARR